MSYILSVQITKIRRILNSRWISGSFRSLSAFRNRYLALVQNLKEATTDSNSKEHDNERTIQWILPAHEFHGIPQGSSIKA
jgi:hypothetical protein